MRPFLVAFNALRAIGDASTAAVGLKLLLPNSGGRWSFCYCFLGRLALLQLAGTGAGSVYCNVFNKSGQD